jgi:hypothetical protein
MLSADPQNVLLDCGLKNTGKILISAKDRVKLEN